MAMGPLHDGIPVDFHSLSDKSGENRYTFQRRRTLDAFNLGTSSFLEIEFKIIYIEKSLSKFTCRSDFLLAR